MHYDLLVSCLRNVTCKQRERWYGYDNNGNTTPDFSQKIGFGDNEVDYIITFEIADINMALNYSEENMYQSFLDTDDADLLHYFSW